MKKRLSIIISIIVILGIIIGITLAFIEKDIFSQNVTFNFEGITITYNAGNNISGVKLIPVTTLQKGLTDGTAIEKTITVSSNKTAYFNLYMDIETLDSGLKYNYVVYQLKKGNDIVANGNFANSNAGDTITLLSDEEINSTTSTYTLNIWIDGSVDNSENVENQDYEFILRADASDQAPIKATDKIIQLAGNCTSWKSGFSGVCATSPYDDNGTTKYHEYRYVGANVNNWVRFNNDDYRIIGVFDDNSHGVEGEYLIKLIAENPLGAYAWGATNTAPEYTTYSMLNNNWETANANILLNEYWLNSTDTSSTYKSCSDWTYYLNGNNFKTKDCSDIIGYGIQTANLRNYIEPVTWYLKGYDGDGYSKQNFYTCERSDATTVENCTSGNLGAYATKVENKSVGLMYVSDYLYASGYYASTSTISASLQYYGQQNWLYKGFEWTITPIGSGSNFAFDVDNGRVYYFVTNKPYALRPTFYLKSTIKIKSGAGTIASPFVIG